MGTAKKSRKVVITGAGDVGASFAYALMQAGLAEDITLIDLNTDLVQGQVLDLAHGMPFVPPVMVRAGTSDDYADATVIVITAGAKQRPEESRLDLVNRNAAIVAGIVDDIVARDSQAIVDKSTIVMEESPR
jgi:L-lactate dehydrogenase